MLQYQCSRCDKTFEVRGDSGGNPGSCPECGFSIGPCGTKAKTHKLAVEGETALVLWPQDSEPSTLPPQTDHPGQLDPPLEKTTLPGSASPVPTTQKAPACDFLGPAESPDELGRLGPYRVLRLLGSGGMGMVFQAEDPHLQRLVALKVMLPALAAQPPARQRFLREARAAAAIEHDHIVPIYQVGEDRDVPFLAMQCLKGESVHERLRREQRLPVSEVLRIGREVSLGLAAAHDKGLIHRDIKPANLWLEPGGRAKILDFGLVRAMADPVGPVQEGNLLPVSSEPSQLTGIGAILGTPAYMAPEQVEGQAVDARCDLFSLGCVLYQMCTGLSPFQGPDRTTTLMKVVGHQPQPPQEINPEVPPKLAQLIMELLAKNPADRPESARHVAQAIDKDQVEQSRQGRRKPWLWMVAAGVGLLMVGLFLFRGMLLPATTPEKPGNQIDDVLQGHRDRLIVEEEKMTQIVEANLGQARRALANDAAAAWEILQNTLSGVRDHPDLSDGVRDALAARLQSALREASDQGTPAEYRGIIKELRRIPRPVPSLLKNDPWADLAPPPARAWDVYRADYSSFVDPFFRFLEEPEKFPLRASVSEAIKALKDTEDVTIMEGFLAVAPITLETKKTVMEAQAQLGLYTFKLEEVHDKVKRVDRRQEKSLRWQAHYDYVQAALGARIIFMMESNYALAEIRRDALPDLGPKALGWRLSRVEKPQIRGETKVKQLVKETREILLRIEKEHAGTPWAFLAQRERTSGWGLEWQARNTPNP